VTSLLWILLRLLNQDEQMKPGLHKRISTLQRSNACICWSFFSAQHKAPEVSSVLLESTPGRWSSDKGAKKFLNVEMEQKTPRKGEPGHPASGDETATLRNYNLLVPRVFTARR
jgi:hypothetical protein